MPRLLLWLETSVFTAWLCLTRLLRRLPRLRWRHATVLHVGQKFRVLEELLSDAPPVGVYVATDFVHHASLVEPPHHLLAR